MFGCFIIFKFNRYVLVNTFAFASILQIFSPYITLKLDSAIFVINIYNRLKFEIDKIP